ncbi:MAG: MBL fold metallo-hydrolase [Aulosira sp. ZfuVER01]|nr:MBL fold metallo-hydrolase [Aulosira sp. ZfuVER01]MDZ8000778.1 MBL fold metallo-hydrolase [Aulosira sp. DedVER01a]MDZ8055087.1 MBL fold metallo-hydrolase [Aulosira sp. ZfuCHP01]
MKISLLNHACVVIEINEIKLLCDPWLFGTCFEGGWGLRFQNVAALDQAASCTHLWISHFHSDHFHVPTLKALLKINPEIIILGNNSFNFQMDDVLQRIGFKNVISLFERKEITIGKKIGVKRFPTTGIDNMLLIQSDEGVILNYNDCNLPCRARENLAKKIGHIDIFLNNFNHAGKLLDFPLPSEDKVKENLKAYFVNNFSSFSPKWVIPFASFHYYRASESQQQNHSMLRVEDLVGLDRRIINLKVGESVEFNQTLFPKVLPSSIALTSNPIEIEIWHKSIQFEQLQDAAEKFRKNINIKFLGLTFLLKKLKIYIFDLEKSAVFDMKRGLLLVPMNNSNYHIKAHSESLYKWFTKPYGTDSFVVGAHFDLLNENTVPIKWQFLFSLLVENKLDLISLLKMMFVPSGILFMINRREEITALLRQGKFNPAEQR